MGGTCQLIAKTVKKDEYGVQQTEETKRKVFCNVFSLWATRLLRRRCWRTPRSSYCRFARAHTKVSG